MHIPFCVHKCSYCDFYSFTKYTPSEIEQFIEQLKSEAKQARTWLDQNGKTLPAAKSIFFGGGTPSLLSCQQLQELFLVLEQEFEWDSRIEITLEANPETVTAEKAYQWFRQTPINRISLGAQSFNSKYLAALERMGSANTIENSVQLLRKAGCKNLNLDLIMAIPGQTPEEVQSDIHRALSLHPNHLSNYQLSLKPGHTLFKSLPSSDLGADLYESARKSILENGFSQYEISNFSQTGFECAHNLLYWSGGDFLGLGPSAASRFFWEGVFVHKKQIAEFSKYLSQVSITNEAWQVSTVEQTQLEALFLEIRKNSGIDMNWFEARYGLSLSSSKSLSKFKETGLVEIKEATLVLTDKGRLLADSIVTKLMD